ncbi:MAG: hypothetical protein AUK63_42 [bacterium P3]|nr:MAG: hypothetical protein AUK63_42 [bacterium P3]
MDQQNLVFKELQYRVYIYLFDFHFIIYSSI